MMTPLFLRHAMNALMRWVSRIPEVREVLHTLALHVTRDPHRSELTRARVFNILAVSSAPEGMVEFTAPVPELPGTSLHLRLDLKDELSRQWYYWGYDRYEPEVRTLMWELIQGLPKGEAGDVIDIGANLGYFTLYLGTLLRHRGAGTVQAFEPSPGVFARLQHNLALNPGLPVKLNEAAVSEKPGRADLFLADEAMWGHCAATLVNKGVDEQVGSVNVAVESIDHFVEQNAVRRVSLIKIDCEGAEAQALIGAAKTIERDRPHIILELIPRYDESYKALFSHPVYQAYRKFLITSEGLVEHKEVFSSYQDRDWLFTMHPPEALVIQR